MIPTFVIFLREGIEASMVVAILLSYLDRIGQRKHFRDVFVGVAAAFLLVLVGGIAAYTLIDEYSGSRTQVIFETATYLVAAAALTYMTFWMQSHARTLGKELEAKSTDALERRSRFGLSVLAFTSVGREGVETMVFTLAIIFASRTKGATTSNSRWLLVGAILGLVVALSMAYAIYRAGAKINLKRFFQILGIVLMVFAAGLLSDAVENLQQLGWLPGGSQHLWSTEGILAEQSAVGDVLHQLIGYASNPTILQFVVWIGFLASCVLLFVVRSHRQGARMQGRLARQPSSVGTR